MRLGWVAMALTLTVGGASADDGIGRLFTTAAEREVLGAAAADDGRWRRLAGMVRREGGGGVAWLGGGPMRPGDEAAGARMVGLEPGGRVRFRLEGGEVTVAVGERFDPRSGEVSSGGSR